jgi:hypothetical protein
MSLTDDLSDGFFRGVRDMALRLGCDPLDLLKVWFSESIGVYADAKNPLGKGAFGLNQMIPSRLVGAGYRGEPDDYIKLSAEDQLPHVENYYSEYRGKLTSVGRLYQVNYLPATIDTVTKPDGILSAKDGVYDWAYNGNPALDPTKKGTITIADLEKAANALTSSTLPIPKRGGVIYKNRWEEIVKRFAAVPRTAASAVPNLFVGMWQVDSDDESWQYKFGTDGNVTWGEKDKKTGRFVTKGTGTWEVNGSQLKMKWLMSEEVWNLPLALKGQGGEVTPNVGPKFTVTVKRL